MPLPVADLVLYATLALIFLGFGLMCYVRIAPVKRFVSIRELRGMRTRILRGDSAAYAEAYTLVRCTRPSIDVWNIFTWLAIVFAVSITMWIVLMSLDTGDRYTNALAAEEDCV
jgi:hypothetical protein